MSNAEADNIIDLQQYVAAWRGERYRTFVLHGAPLSGKSEYARALTEIVPGGLYLDMLTIVAGSPELSNKVDLLDPLALRDLVLKEAETHHSSLVMVDDLDFLVAIWGDLVAFRQMVATLAYTRAPAIIGFVLQSYPELENWQLLDSQGRSRIIRLNEVHSL